MAKTHRLVPVGPNCPLHHAIAALIANPATRNQRQMFAGLMAVSVLAAVQVAIDTGDNGLAASKIDEARRDLFATRKGARRA